MDNVLLVLIKHFLVQELMLDHLTLVLLVTLSQTELVKLAQMEQNNVVVQLKLLNVMMDST